MDKNGIIQPHSELKLTIYKKYLDRYLQIMIKQTYFKSIFIVEPFAGKGISDNGKEGSAKIAYNIVNSNKNSGKDICLFLNEKQFYKVLEKNIPQNDMTKIYNFDADSFINIFLQEIEKLPSCHTLMFIDPWGYTQIKHETYNILFKKGNIDILIFIPIYQIYRFLRKEIDEQQLKPISEFLSDMGISEKDARESRDLDDFICKISEAIKHKSGTDFVYHKELKNVSHNNKHVLFFITRNILGADKFLEVLYEINDSEVPLFNDIRLTDDKEFLQKLKSYHILDNISFYEICIKEGYSKKQIKSYLENAEEEGKIKITQSSTQKRKKNCYYIDYTYYKGQDVRIRIEIL